MVKAFSKLEGEGNFNLIQNIYKTPSANIILDGEKFKAFPQRSDRR